MTDQDKIPRFSDGEPALPISDGRQRRESRRNVFILLLALATAWFILFKLPFLFLPESLALGEEPQVIFDQAGECSIDADLRVRGSKRAACVEKLATAARLAKAEMLVNERRRK